MSDTRKLLSETEAVIESALAETRACEVTDKNPLSAPVAPPRKNINSKGTQGFGMKPKNKLAAPYGAYSVVRAGIANGSPSMTDKHR